MWEMIYGINENNELYEVHETPALPGRAVHKKRYGEQRGDESVDAVV